MPRALETISLLSVTVVLTKVESMTHNAMPPEVQQDTPQDGWHRISSRYVWSDLIFNLLWIVVIVAVVAVIVRFSGDEEASNGALIIGGILVAFSILSAFFSFRRMRSIGYQLREDDFLFRRGFMFERIVAVPYGRLQLVDMNRGPIARMLGLATLKFVTASAATGVNLPGLEVAEAEALRDRLVELAETRRSGL